MTPTNDKIQNSEENIIHQLKTEFENMKAAYKANAYPELSEVLLKLKKALIENEQDIYDALKRDYGYRSEYDTFMADVMPSVLAIKYALKNLKKWMKPSRRNAGLLLMPSSIKVHFQPLGVVGVITPWNFPFYLALGPAIQALAAGNRVMIKTSEFTPNSNMMLRKVLSSISDYVTVIDGEAETGAAFSALPFDHLIFTGSTMVGKLVAKSAAENLTPVTLELGGKSPTIIAEDADMEVAVDAIIFGKSLNSGQICVAPDYIFTPESKAGEFINKFRERYAEYHLDTKNINAHTNIVSDKQFARLQSFIEDAKDKGAKIYPIKKYEPKHGRCIYPHLATNVNDGMKIMQEEIFGSILPIMTYTDIEEVLTYINDRPRPLSLYIMSSDNELIEDILKSTHSGGVAINDTVMHVAADDAPFGGIGPSGMGHYHGYEGFLTFSKAKTVLYSPSWMPRNRLLLKYRDIFIKILRLFFLR